MAVVVVVDSVRGTTGAGEHAAIVAAANTQAAIIEILMVDLPSMARRWAPMVGRRLCKDRTMSIADRRLQNPEDFARGARERV